MQQHNVTPHRKRPYSLRRGHSVGERRAIRHQRCRCDNSVLMPFYNGAVYAGSEPEIVSVDNQAPHAESLAGRVEGLRERLWMGTD